LAKLPNLMEIVSREKRAGAIESAGRGRIVNCKPISSTQRSIHEMTVRGPIDDY